MNPLTLILFILGFVLLISGAELLVRGASRLAVAAGISPLVVGLTIVAYGTSAPELAVTVQAGFAGQADIALGNVVGSNISNILLVLGISAAVAPLAVSQQLIRWDIPIMIGLSILVYIMGVDGKIGRLDGSILFAGAVAYTVITVYQSRKKNKVKPTVPIADIPDSPTRVTTGQVLWQLAYILIGLALLIVGARWLVNGAVVVARLLGINELIVGLTIVAVGTSLPEIATSIVAGLRGARAIAVGNAVGSNIFNLLLVLGVSSAVTPVGVNVPPAALHFDIPVMIAAAVACLPVFFIGYKIHRWEGFLFLGYYAAYNLYLFLNATHHSALGPFNMVMMTFVIPLTVVTLLVLSIRFWRQNNGPAET